MSLDVSELMDGESDESAQKRALAALREDQTARAAWERYHLIGDALRGTAAVQSERGGERDFQARVFAALAAEPTVLAPQPKPARAPRAWMRYSVAAAATVAAFGLFTWFAPLEREQTQVAENASAMQRALDAGEANSAVDDPDPYLEAHYDVSPAIRPGVMRASFQAPAGER